MVQQEELKILIQKHFDLLDKKETLNISNQDKIKLINYFSRIIYYLQIYDNINININNNSFVLDDDFISTLCALNNLGAS